MRFAQTCPPVAPGAAPGASSARLTVGALPRLPCAVMTCAPFTQDAAAEVCTIQWLGACFGWTSTQRACFLYPSASVYVYLCLLQPARLELVASRRGYVAEALAYGQRQALTQAYERARTAAARPRRRRDCARSRSRSSTRRRVRRSRQCSRTCRRRRSRAGCAATSAPCGRHAAHSCALMLGRLRTPAPGMTSGGSPAGGCCLRGRPARRAAQ